jgi:ribonuclease P protein component
VTKKFTLGKNERLKSRKRIENLFNEGKKLVVSPFMVLYTVEQASAEPHLLFGAGVSSKNFRKSVDRNRIKRLIREAYRLQKTSLSDKIKERQLQLDVFFVYTGKELPLYKDLFKKIGLILNKLDKLTGG